MRRSSQPRLPALALLLALLLTAICGSAAQRPLPRRGSSPSTAGWTSALADSSTLDSLAPSPPPAEAPGEKLYCQVEEACEPCDGDDKEDEECKATGYREKLSCQTFQEVNTSYQVRQSAAVHVSHCVPGSSRVGVCCFGLAQLHHH